MVSFKDKWLDTVARKNTVLCAGLDPAIYGMGRGEDSLGENVDKEIWAMPYLKAVAPYCAAVKFNGQYWQDSGDQGSVNRLAMYAKHLDLVLIDDSKRPDIGSTNDAGLFYAAKKGFDASTIAPYAGNLVQASDACHNHGLASITMCLMSNPEYETVKHELVPVKGFEDEFRKKDLVKIKKKTYVEKYIYLARTAHKYNVDGIVIGAPSDRNHILEKKLEIVAEYYRDGLVLMPGVGAQGGEAQMIWEYFDPSYVIVNVGRGLMFPKIGDWKSAAKEYCDMLNEIREQ